MTDDSKFQHYCWSEGVTEMTVARSSWLGWLCRRERQLWTLYEHGMSQNTSATRYKIRVPQDTSARGEARGDFCIHWSLCKLHFQIIVSCNNPTVNIAHAVAHFRGLCRQIIKRGIDKARVWHLNGLKRLLTFEGELASDSHMSMFSQISNDVKCNGTLQRSISLFADPKMTRNCLGWGRASCGASNRKRLRYYNSRGPSWLITANETV